MLARVFWDDRAFMSSTLLHGTLTLRLCIVNHATETNVVAPARFEAFADRRDLALDLTNLSTASPAPC